MDYVNALSYLELNLPYSRSEFIALAASFASALCPSWKSNWRVESLDRIISLGFPAWENAYANAADAVACVATILYNIIWQFTFC